MNSFSDTTVVITKGIIISYDYNWRRHYAYFYIATSNIVTNEK